MDYVGRGWPRVEGYGAGPTARSWIRLSRRANSSDGKGLRLKTLFKIDQNQKKLFGLTEPLD